MDETSRNGLPPGTLVAGKYEIDREHGQGAFSLIYVAHSNEGTFAVKEYFPKDCAARPHGNLRLTITDPARFEAGLSAFMLEAEVTARFAGHPFLVSGYEVFEQNGTWYQIMEYIEGPTLKTLLSGPKTLPPHQAVYTLLPILKALALLHEHGIVHRDVSPDNVTVTPDGHAVLMDLGSAIRGDTAPEVVLKPGYSPEEQYRADGRFGPRTDIYAAGALLYRMITGKVPPESATRIAEDTLLRPSELADCPITVENAIMRALAVRAGDRFGSADAFYQALLEKHEE